MKLPSPELLSAVLGVNVTAVNQGAEEVYKMDINAMQFTSAGYGPKAEIGVIIDGIPKSINIYELMHLMKMWAPIYSRILLEDYTGSSTTTIYLRNIDTREVVFKVIGKPAFEAVTLACEWILNNKD